MFISSFVVARHVGVRRYVEFKTGHPVARSYVSLN